MMVTQANDSYGLALLGLREHATASALGPIRNVAETYAYAKWLLESPNENVRLGCAYRLTLDAIDQLGEQKRMLERVAPGSEVTLQMAPMLGVAVERMTSRLQELAQEDGVTIAAKPRRSELWRSTCWIWVATCSIHCCLTQASTQALAAVRRSMADQAKPSLTSILRASTMSAPTGHQ
jgi:hypothetical protein